MAPYVTWGMLNVADSAGAHDAGIHTMLYTNPNQVDATMPEFPSLESGFAHDCTGARITITGLSRTTYLTNPASAELAQKWQYHVQTAGGIWGGKYDVTIDDTADVVYRVSALPCGFDQTLWTAQVNALNATLGSAIVFNGLGALEGVPDRVSPSIGLLPTTNGGTIEGCYSNRDNNRPMPSKKVWMTYENTEIQVLAARKVFLCRGMNNLPDSSSQVYRTYMYASFLLTYDPALSIFSDAFAVANNGFNVEPESQLIAKDPVVSQPSDISQLSTSQSVYGRQYRNCYYAGNWVGPCATVVNSDTPGYSHPFPWPTQYHHTLVLTGGDILDGGRAYMNGPPPPAMLSSPSAVIVFK